jgi:hypothetical protein
VRLRDWKGTDGGLYELIGMRRSDLLALNGVILRDGRPYTGSLSVQLRTASNELLASVEAQSSRITIERPIAGGNYQLISQADGLFAPQLDCCQSTQALRVTAIPPDSRAVWEARAQLSGAMVGGLLLLILARYLWLHGMGLALLSGDSLVYSVDGQERAVGLRGAQGWQHYLRPERVVLTKTLLQQRLYRGRKSVKARPSVAVRQVRRLAIEVNGVLLTASDAQGSKPKVLKDGSTVRYVPSPKRFRKRRPPSGKGGPRRTPATRSSRRR